jgi:hypothetical protein
MRQVSCEFTSNSICFGLRIIYTILWNVYLYFLLSQFQKVHKEGTTFISPKLFGLSQNLYHYAAIIIPLNGGSEYTPI